MRLTIVTPLPVVVETQQVAHLRAEDETGAFGVLPGHADFLTALAVSVVTWRYHEGGAHHAALRGAMLAVRANDIEWCPGAGSNHRHTDFQSAKMTVKL